MDELKIPDVDAVMVTPTKLVFDIVMGDLASNKFMAAAGVREPFKIFGRRARVSATVESNPLGHTYRWFFNFSLSVALQGNLVAYYALVGSELCYADPKLTMLSNGRRFHDISSLTKNPKAQQSTYDVTQQYSLPCGAVVDFEWVNWADSNNQYGPGDIDYLVSAGIAVPVEEE